MKVTPLCSGIRYLDFFFARNVDVTMGMSTLGQNVDFIFGFDYSQINAQEHQHLKLNPFEIRHVPAYLAIIRCDEIRRSCCVFRVIIFLNEFNVRVFSSAMPFVLSFLVYPCLSTVHPHCTLDRH
jgi:hypothetical protein